ncbi:MAG: hypothetical protein OHK0021_24010 [Bryobacter sp.]
MNAIPPIEHEFGPYRFNSAKRLLFRSGELLPLPPKALDVLAVLLAERGAVLDKATLLSRAWPDTQVEEVGLARNISLLRKELGDWIETVPKKGYRFVPAPSDVPLLIPAASSWRGPLRRGSWALLLVSALGFWLYWQFFLPSQYLAPGYVALAVAHIEPIGSQTARADQLRESLVTDLAKIEGVHVLSPTTVNRYRSAFIPASWMARLLGLAVLVEGTVAADGQIALRLVDVHTGRVIVADSQPDSFLTATRKALKTK